MKIVAVTDIHGRTNYPKETASALQKADIVLIAGDITNFGNCDDAEHVLERLASSNKRILAVPGNCDRLGVNKTLTAKNMNLHGVSISIGSVALYGIGGCSKTPFHTPQEYSEKEISQILNSLAVPKEAQTHILVSHAPPHNTKLDKVLIGFHVGSKAVRKFIEDSQPDLVVCGHIHEARGADRIGKTLIINPGPFPKHYGVINVDGVINYELR
jgi:putative phosphoesterase